MADIDLVIKIPQESYNNLKIGCTQRVSDSEMIEAIANGIPLPKGHSDLIYRNEIEYMKAIHDLKWGKITASECATKIINSAPTIIEADKE